MARSLRLAVVNVLVFLGAGATIYFRMVPQPWDLLALVVFMLGCPIGGGWLGISTAAREMSHRSNKLQPLIGMSLSLAVLICGILLLTSLRL